MNREEGMSRKRSIKSAENIDAEVCSNDSGSQSGPNKLEGQKKARVLNNPERQLASNHFLTNWCRRFFCIQQANQEAEEDEVILYTPSKSKS